MKLNVNEMLVREKRIDKFFKLQCLVLVILRLRYVI